MNRIIPIAIGVILSITSCAVNIDTSKIVNGIDRNRVLEEIGKPDTESNTLACWFTSKENFCVEFNSSGLVVKTTKMSKTYQE